MSRTLAPLPRLARSVVRGLATTANAREWQWWEVGVEFEVGGGRAGAKGIDGGVLEEEDSGTGRRRG